MFFKRVHRLPKKGEYFLIGRQAYIPFKSFEGVVLVRFNISRQMFTDREFLLTQTDNFKVTAFKYSTGVEALKVCNNRGHFIILPFQGQQIWRAKFDGRELQMKTKFDEPQPGKEYLETYGGFLLHCGINSMGLGDSLHPQHGEIPNVEYQKAYIEISEECVSVGGDFYYDKSFVKNYTFSPRCSLCKDSTVLKINVKIENRRHYPMEYMYLCHINFRPTDGAELYYSADYDKLKFYSNGDNATKQMKEYEQKLTKDVTIHNKIGGDGQCYDPELCFKVVAKADENNRAYCVQKAEDFSWYVSYPADVLPVGIRWISRTLDEDSLGMLLPATGEHLGYNYAKEHNQVKFLEPMGTLEFEIEAGVIDSKKANDTVKLIDKLNKERI